MPDWNLCPICGAQILVDEDERLHSPGFKFCPAAFELPHYKWGESLAHDQVFYNTFVRYVLSVVREAAQLVYFRQNVIDQAKRFFGDQELDAQSTLWCALSVATQQYFSQKALQYKWSVEQQNELSQGWLRLLAPAFIRDHADKKMELSVIKNWVSLFLELHRSAKGPLAGCSLCPTRCQFGYDVSQLIKEAKVQVDFTLVINQKEKSASDEAAWFCWLLSKQFYGEENCDFAYCAALKLIEATTKSDSSNFALSTDAQLIFAHKVRQSLEEIRVRSAPPGPSVFGPARAMVMEALVQQALAGQPWQIIGAGPMQVNNISAEEVLAELEKRKAGKK
ncbi:MAG TPA: hypothetical protein V6C89_00825 [Drouetiella sp.]